MILEVEKLERNYRPFIRETSFNLALGECLAIVGPNGSGKTTLIKTLLGFLNFQGKIKVNGKKLSEYSKKDLANEFAYVPQLVDSECSLTVEQFLMLSFYASSKIDLKRKNQAIKLFKLDNILMQSLNTLSGGQRQKVMLAGAFCQNPKIYFLDEPFSALDTKSIKDLVVTIQQIKLSGASIILALHNLDLISKCADRVLYV